MYDDINDNEKWKDLMQKKCGIIEFTKREKRTRACTHRSVRVRLCSRYEYRSIHSRVIYQ